MENDGPMNSNQKIRKKIRWGRVACETSKEKTEVKKREKTSVLETKWRRRWLYLSNAVIKSKRIKTKTDTMGKFKDTKVKIT